MSSSAPLLLDLSHTSHTPARTGVQRVARSLFTSLGEQAAVQPVCFDPWQRAWRPLDEGELAAARGEAAPGRGRGARWTPRRKIRGLRRRVFGGGPALPAGSGLIVPEIPLPVTGRALPQLLARIAGPRVAFFFDAIPLTHPEFTPRNTVARFPSFMVELLRFDGIAAISQTSADHLRDYWRWLGAADTPPIEVVPLGAVRPPAAAQSGPPADVPRVLCVGTIEGRKNHLALLDAAETLWAAGLRFELQLAGVPRPETAAPALRRIEELRHRGRPLVFVGAIDDTALESAWAACAFSVYPSAIEGFGLPIVESLARGKPCVCAGSGAPGELIAGGGCLGMDSADAKGLATALRRMLEDTALRDRLAAEARARKLTTWSDTARHLREWMSRLPRRHG